MRARKRHREPKKGPRRVFTAAEDKSYLVFYKPYGVLCQFTKPEDSDKSTLADFGFPPDVYSIGRLDYDSEGLLILSDDGHLNQALLDPVHGHDRTYLAQVENIPGSEQILSLEHGIVLDGEQTRPALAQLLTGEPALPPRPAPIRFRQNIPTAWLKLTVKEGRNHQVRRMTAAVGCPTLRLVRIAIGRLHIFGLVLQPGEWMRLSPEQVGHLFQPSDEMLRIPLAYA